MRQKLDSKNLKNQIKLIFEEKNLDKSQKLLKLKQILEKLPEIDSDSLKLINSEVKGIYGSEYLLTKYNFLTETEFYKFLKNRYSDSAEVLLSYGDLLLLSKQYHESFDAFNQAFYLQPTLLFQAPGELSDFIKEHGSEIQKISYDIALLRAFILDKDWEDATEQYDDLIEAYGKNNQIIQQSFQDPKIKKEILSLFSHDRS